MGAGGGNASSMPSGAAGGELSGGINSSIPEIESGSSINSIASAAPGMANTAFSPAAAITGGGSGAGLGAGVSSGAASPMGGALNDFSSIGSLSNGSTPFGGSLSSMNGGGGSM